MVNSVSFGRMGIYDKANVDAPQANQRQSEPMANHPRYEEPKKKSHTGLKVLGGLAVVAAVVAGLAYGAKTGKFDVAKVADLTKSFKDNKFVAWAKPAVKATLGAMETVGNSINSGAKYVAEKAEPAINAVKNFFKKPEVVAAE